MSRTPTWGSDAKQCDETHPSRPIVQGRSRVQRTAELGKRLLRLTTLLTPEGRLDEYVCGSVKKYDVLLPEIAWSDGPQHRYRNGALRSKGLETNSRPGQARRLTMNE